MAQACLGTLLRSDGQDGKSDSKRSPLVKYAAQYWVDHAHFEKVSSRVRDGMDDLFDGSKPHFAAWLKVHDMDENWLNFTVPYWHRDGSPLYYAAFCGFYDLAERLITKHPDQVNARGGLILAPLPAALYKKHFRLANLLHNHGANLDCRGLCKRTPLHSASTNGSVDIVRWLLNHGADANTLIHRCMTLQTIHKSSLFRCYSVTTQTQTYNWTPLASLRCTWLSFFTGEKIHST